VILERQVALELSQTPPALGAGTIVEAIVEEIVYGRGSYGTAPASMTISSQSDPHPMFQRRDWKSEKAK
jgi:hypothetical protein